MVHRAPILYRSCEPPHLHNDPAIALPPPRHKQSNVYHPIPYKKHTVYEPRCSSRSVTEVIDKSSSLACHLSSLLLLIRCGFTPDHPDPSSGVSVPKFSSFQQLEDIYVLHMREMDEYISNSSPTGGPSEGHLGGNVCPFCGSDRCQWQSCPALIYTLAEQSNSNIPIAPNPAVFDDTQYDFSLNQQHYLLAPQPYAYQPPLQQQQQLAAQSEYQAVQPFQQILLGLDRGSECSSQLAQQQQQLLEEPRTTPLPLHPLYSSTAPRMAVAQSFQPNAVVRDLRLGCPFHRNNPNIAGRNSSCLGNGFKGIHKLK